jgi:hypothetical protein
LESLDDDGMWFRNEMPQTEIMQSRDGVTVKASATDFRPWEFALINQQRLPAHDGELPCDERAGRSGPNNDDVPVLRVRSRKLTTFGGSHWRE